MHSRIHHTFSFITGTRPDVGAVADILARFGQDVVDLLERTGVRIVTLVTSQKIADFSPTLAAAGVDENVPAVFVATEARIYVRCPLPLTVGHALGLAIDFSLGRPSAHDPQIVAAYRAAVARNAFITSLAYATPGTYVAEALRAFYGCDEPIAGWPAATPERLTAIDPVMYGLTARLASRIPIAAGRLAS
jgi:hypothetical protein